MVPPFAVSKAADARPAQLRVRYTWFIHFWAYQSIRFDRALAIPAGSPGLQTTAIQSDHAGDCGVAARDAARHGAAAGLQAGRFARRQPYWAGVDPRILHWFVLSHGLLEPGSILSMAAAPGGRSADGGHAAADDDYQYRCRPR